MEKLVSVFPKGVLLLRQYKEFCIEFGYEEPRFIFESTEEQRTACADYMESGHTILETEIYYINFVKSNQK